MTLENRDRSALVSNIRRILFLRIFMCSLAMPMPVMVLFWQQNGLSLIDIGTLQAVFSLTLAVLEVPGGLIADRVGRKPTLVIGALCLLSGTGMYSITQSMFPFFLAEVLLASGASLMSGTDQALMYESLQGLKRESEYSKYWGIAIGIDLASSSLGSLLGGVLARLGIRVPLYGAFFGFVCLATVALSLRGSPKGYEDKGALGQFLRLKSVLREGRVLWLIALGSVFTMAFQIVQWTAQPLLKSLGMKPEMFGATFAAVSLIGGLTALLSDSLLRRLGGLIVSSGALLILIAGTVMLGTSSGLCGAALSLILACSVRGIITVMISNLMNRAILTEVRATVLSVKNMCDRFLYGGMMYGVGWVNHSFGPAVGLLTIGGVTAVLCIALLLIRPRSGAVMQ